VPDIDFEKVYAGLPPNDWHTLRRLVLDAAKGRIDVAVPSRLIGHEAAAHLAAFLETRDRGHLNRAAEALCPLYPEKAWLALEKS
jgi:hypothetical protein